MKLAGQSAHRAAEIIRSEEHHPAEAEKPRSTESSYHPEEQSFPEGSGERTSRGTQDLEGLDREDDDEPGEEHR